MRRLPWLLILIATCGAAAAQEFAAREKLRTHSAEFRREVIQVTNGVWVASGFSDANSVLIDGEGGSIVVDTTSDAEDARKVKAEFAKLSTAPVRAIIYTHSHPDHTGGAGIFAGNDHPEILAHRLFVDRVPDVGRNGRDGGDQFGSTLPDALFINAGTGLEFGRHPAPTAYVPPTRTFSEEKLELTIAGVRLQLLHTLARRARTSPSGCPIGASCCRATISTRPSRPSTRFAARACVRSTSGSRASA